MSVSLYRWTEACEGQPCVGDCDKCKYVFVDLIRRQDAIEAVFGRSHEIIKMRIGNLSSAHCTDCPLKGVSVKLP